ncbi:hypothetical protein [uncultured Lacinutrix sp.]|uniref:hypothetical protein n=1 Tax=uncultured Lacinutrix sp. TaxID=574032 RepID=UPI0026016DC3|nr:hypothetical protein [uncultured Lacinutrix sp.]
MLINKKEIKRLSLDHYSNLNLKANPFSYLNDQELLQTIEPRVELETIAKYIKSCTSCFIQLYGNKGFGKSTHLQSLYYDYFPEADYYKLKKNKKQYITRTHKVLFVDSFQLLSLKNKLQLLKSQERIIIASHYSHSFLNLKNRELNRSFNFNQLSLNIELLNRIVTNKIKLVQISKTNPIPMIKKEYLHTLLKKNKNNLRAIERELYQDFINLNKDFYEL